MSISLQRGVLKYEKVRFAAVGAVNTAVDFGILFSLSLFLGFPVFIANIISTSCALAVSYLLNKKAVFGNQEKPSARQIILFLVVTVTGLWVIQTIVIMVSWWILYGILGQFNNALYLIIGKIIATCASLVWNYLWYSRLVFRKKST